MMPDNDCPNNTDPLKLVRDGTSQDQRAPRALQPDYAPVTEHTPAHGMVFARAYAAYLRYYDSQNIAVGDWVRFFDSDVSVRLAIAAVQDVNDYRARVKECLDALTAADNPPPDMLKQNLGRLFSSIGSLATQLDMLKSRLPDTLEPSQGTLTNTPAPYAFKTALQQHIKNQLAPAFKRLITYYKAGTGAGAEVVIEDAVPAPVLRIMDQPVTTFEAVLANGLSQDWISGSAADHWDDYTNGIVADDSVYGAQAGVFHRINHIATHTLFTSILDAFLKAYARVASDARTALDESLTGWDGHEPHYALFLAFLRLFEFANQQANTLTQRHLDFYYRDILQLNEKPATPSSAHLLIELARQAPSHLIAAGELFKAGKDDHGIDAFYANERDVVANQASITALKTMYRHGAEPVGTKTPTDIDAGRLFASPVANSGDGMGAKLTTVDQSWHPFFNKDYTDGTLTAIQMPQAEVGFAISSHYLLLAEGERTITVTLNLSSKPNLFTGEHLDDVACALTSEKGWITGKVTMFTVVQSEDNPADKKGNSTSKGRGRQIKPLYQLQMIVTLSGADPAVTPYVAKTHGYGFDTTLPVLLVKLLHHPPAQYVYLSLQDIQIQSIDLLVDVKDIRTLAVSNDFGPVDTAKPFQPFGPSPAQNSAFIIGSREVFQKNLLTATLKIGWGNTPSTYDTANPKIMTRFLKDGSWVNSLTTPVALKTATTPVQLPLNSDIEQTSLNLPDLQPNAQYSLAATHGYIQLFLDNDIGQAAYQTALLLAVANLDTTAIAALGKPPAGPSISALRLDYTAQQPTILLNTADPATFSARAARFFHLAPFGYAEQHPYLKNDARALDKLIYLLPQFSPQPASVPLPDAAEFYFGVTGLKPPQNLAVLFQVADGTADPLAVKPKPHIRWSYLRSNEWIDFARSEVEDNTAELLNSGVVTFAVPDDASLSNTLLPAGMHWLRAAVDSETAAVCRLMLVAAQAIKVVFADKGNDPAFPAKVLPAGTISKLDQPVADIKTITQPFATFGGRGAEAAGAFYTRVSERLRHKDRAIALWDYERLVLEAFPQIDRVKCLNHTQYEPVEGGLGVYRELAPGHVTLVTIPNQQALTQRDPLRPNTSLGLLDDIAAFLNKRLSCFVILHTANPQFEEVQAKFNVRFYDGIDETFYRLQLQQSLSRFLSPWAFPGGGRPDFGGKIRKSVLVNFVEELPYVDYVTDFTLSHTYFDDNGNKTIRWVDEVEGSRAVSILVSAREHAISVIAPADQQARVEECGCKT